MSYPQPPDATSTSTGSQQHGASFSSQKHNIVVINEEIEELVEDQTARNFNDEYAQISIKDGDSDDIRLFVPETQHDNMSVRTNVTNVSILKEPTHVDKSGAGRGSLDNSGGSIKFVESNDRMSNTTADNLLLKEMNRFDHLDESIKLFMSMPKGLEYFISSGPPKQANDYNTYQKECKQHLRLVQELTLQEMPKEQRKKALVEKTLKLKEAMRNFNHFIEDMDRKESKAKVTYVRLLKERIKLQLSIPNSMADLVQLEMSKRRIEMKIKGYQPMVDFITAVLKAQGSGYNFKNFAEVIHRHETLSKAFQRLLCTYLRGVQALDTIQDLYDNMRNEYVQDVIRLKGIIKEKQAERDVLLHSIAATKLVIRSQNTNRLEKDANAFQMKNSITNMVRMLRNYRQFTIKRLLDKDDEVSQIEAIGLILFDYKDILSGVNRDIKAKRSKSKQIAKIATKYSQSDVTDD